MMNVFILNDERMQMMTLSQRQDNRRLEGLCFSVAPYIQFLFPVSITLKRESIEHQLASYKVKLHYMTSNQSDDESHWLLLVTIMGPLCWKFGSALPTFRTVQRMARLIQSS